MPTFISLHFKLTLETPFATMAMARSGSARRRTISGASEEALAVAPRTDLDTVVLVPRHEILPVNPVFTEQDGIRVFGASQRGCANECFFNLHRFENIAG